MLNCPYDGELCPFWTVPDLPAAVLLLCSACGVTRTHIALQFRVGGTSLGAVSDSFESPFEADFKKYTHTHTRIPGSLNRAKRRSHNRKVVGSIPGAGMSGGGRRQPCVKGILSGEIAK